MTTHWNSLTEINSPPSPIAPLTLAGLWSKEEEAMNVDPQAGLQPEVPQANEVFSWDEWEEPLPPRLAQL